ncbi:hypothetical protein Rmag_0334 [Candidatus Ruthia magnifica str. Cm (Calyptogena magnifica)]|uniref:Uncharacterized protein n=1 Tax=Ruthia magnifica subsp. Calyptogena magnifica TaxID=413404 RepID=A1AW04_RUTMC|nr:hypothetical protein [Candidatus Ruthturnera calyptogenae]ABL02111.1 hypothetical protein Rmag_0334 [Candidatus Ruthia magnifica str. Cm (Calyptogena magnifica)]
MKKQLLIAAVAATMSIAATADVSITGDSYVSFASRKIGLANIGVNKNHDSQGVRLKVVGSTGDTKITAVIRNGSQTRVNEEPKEIDKNRGLHMDSLYVTTKVGPVNIKAGDYWGTIGLGARFSSRSKPNSFAASTKIGNWKVGMYTGDGSNSLGRDNNTNISTSGKVGPVTIGLVHNPKDFTDITLKGIFRDISVEVERWIDKTEVKNDTTFVRIGGKVNNFKWDVAQIRNDVVYSAFVENNDKFTPLGSMLIGKGARGGTATATVNVGDFTKILGVAVSTKLAGNTVKAIITKNTYGTIDEVTGTELIISRSVGGATFTANIAKLSGVEARNLNAANKGLRLDVKF